MLAMSRGTKSEWGAFSVRQGIPGGSDGKESTYNLGDLGSIPGLGRFPGGGHGNPFQYSCLENPHGQIQAHHLGLRQQLGPCQILLLAASLIPGPDAKLAP